jgi:hypothetical protein
VVYFSDRASIFLAPPTHTNNERSNTQRARSPRSFEGPRFLAEPRTFLAFLTGLWGMLTGLSLLFALANVFVDVIPVTEHFQPLYRLPPTVVTPLASVTSLFVLLATSARRGAVAAARGRDRARRSATVSFATGLAALAVFLVGTVLVGSHLYGDTGHTTIGATANSSPATSPSPACTGVLRASPARSYC